jgi:glycosyltransferase involved in cell wall biosynthesis
MSSGLPILTSDVGDCRELVSDALNGYVLPSKDPVQLALRIDALSNIDKRSQMGYESRRKYLSQYTASSMISRIADLYQTILSQK